MNELEKLGHTLNSFKKEDPKRYEHIVEYYGGKTVMFSAMGAVCMYLRGEPPPCCDLCNAPVQIGSKFVDHQEKIRCRHCANVGTIISPEQIIAANLHGYNLGEFPQNMAVSTYLDITCAEHGHYRQQVKNFMSGMRCQQCAQENRPLVINATEWVERSTKVHNGFYDYSATVFAGTTKDVDIICPVHGKFTQNAGVHQRGRGCKKCAILSNRSNLLSTTEEFIRKAKITHAPSTKYDYSQTVYTTAHSEVDIICLAHGKFAQVAYYHLAGNGCQKCGFIANCTAVSSGEREVAEFLLNAGISNIKPSYRDLGFEVDIFLPDYRIGIEYDGVYWHSSDSVELDKKRSTQHLDKTNKCNQNGMLLIHILDMEWNDPVKKEIWKSVLLNKLGKATNKYHARKCKLVDVSYKDAVAFHNANHLQGTATGSENIGLEYDGRLVALGTFCKSRFRKNNDSVFEILRFSTELNSTVVGGFGKIIAEYKKRHAGANLISYANRKWSEGNVYEKTGFTLTNTSEPCYYYTDCKNMWHRTKFQKHKLKDLLKTFDPEKTEVQNMYDNSYRRIWDCGTLTYEMVL